MKSPILRSVLFAAGLVATSALATSAFAQTAAAPDCKSQLEALSKDIAATGLGTPDKPGGGVVRGRKGHSHTGAEMTVMQDHLRAAQRACSAGEEHDAMLHMDVVRAVVHLAEVQHPDSHHYTKPKK
jgi:hypothetical protein